MSDAQDPFWMPWINVWTQLDANWIEYTNQHDIELACFQENSCQFWQANQTPFWHHPCSMTSVCWERALLLQLFSMEHTKPLMVPTLGWDASSVFCAVAMVLISPPQSLPPFQPWNTFQAGTRPKNAPPLDHPPDHPAFILGVSKLAAPAYSSPTLRPVRLTFLTLPAIHLKDGGKVWTWNWSKHQETTGSRTFEPYSSTKRTSTRIINYWGEHWWPLLNLWAS